MRRATQAGLATVFTSAPGIVLSYNEDTKRAEVQVTVHDGNPIPPLPEVPVKFPRGGGYRLVFPIAAGDEVTLLFYQLDPSRFRASGELSLANLLRRHGLYAVALPGSESDLLADYLAASEGAHLGTDDGTVEIVVTPSQIKLGSTAAEYGVANGNTTDANFEAFKQWAATHTHGSAVGATTTTIQPAPDLEVTESEKVLAE